MSPEPDPETLLVLANSGNSRCGDGAVRSMLTAGEVNVALFPALSVTVTC